MDGILNTHLRHIVWTLDLSAILAIENASFHKPWNLCDFYKFMLKSSSLGRVTVHNGEVIGYLLYEKHENRLHVAHVAVKSDYRNRGLGREMLRSLGEPTQVNVTLNVRRSNVRAQRLYHILGFDVVQVLPAHYCDGEDAFLMGYRAF